MLALIALTSIIAGASVPVPQGRDEGQLRLAVDIDLVVFSAAVTDNKDRYVSGLKATDFRVYEDSRLQDITVFSADDLPASVGLIVDNSGSMIDKRGEVASAALVFVGASHPGDELFVVNFNEIAHLGLPPSMRFTRNGHQLRAALTATPAGLTALYDALALGIEHLNTGTRARKALVVLSDGGDNASRRRLDEVLQLAQRSSATIYTIGIYDETNRDRNPRVLRQIARVTGGRAYFPRHLTDLSQVWRDIAGAIRSQYTIGYHSSNPARDGLFRTVTIAAGRDGAGRGLRVTAPDGYLAPAGRAIAQ